MEAILAVLLALSGLLGTATDQGLPYPGGYLGRGQTAEVALVDFRFCVRGCRPDSSAYVRTPAGPLPGSDNPRAVVYMPQGAAVTWTYQDGGCDLLQCTGHDVRLEDGTLAGRELGVITAETGHQSLSWTIPTDAEPESLIRYFCARHATIGMTGSFQVLPIRVLSVTPPHLPSRGGPGVSVRMSGESVMVPRRVGRDTPIGRLRTTLQRERRTDMSDFPPLTHVALTVSDLSVSVPWYEAIFESQPVIDEDTEPAMHHTVYLLGNGTLIGLHQHKQPAPAETFSEFRVGLDHLAFGCANRQELENWARRLDELGVKHGGVVDAAYGSGVSFRDPDGIALEFFAPPS